jgi:meiotic recombination protein SPO11
MCEAVGEIKLGRKKKKRSFDNFKSVRSYSQIWLVVSKMHHLIQLKKHVSQREMFYCFASKFKDQSQSNRTIQAVVSIVKCPRESLGIYASSRGWIAGSLQWNVSWFVID